MASDLLGVFESAPSFEVFSDACRPEGVAGEDVSESSLAAALFNHAAGKAPVPGPRGKAPAGFACSAEERPFFVVTDACHLQVLIKGIGQGGVNGDEEMLATLFVESEGRPPPGTDIVLDFHGKKGRDPGKGEEHGSDDGFVPQAHRGGWNGVQEEPRIGPIHDRGFAGTDRHARVFHTQGRVTFE